MAITQISEVIICIVFKSNYYSAYCISKYDVRILQDIIIGISEFGDHFIPVSFQIK